MDLLPCKAANRISPTNLNFSPRHLCHIDLEVVRTTYVDGGYQAARSVGHVSNSNSIPFFGQPLISRLLSTTYGCMIQVWTHDLLSRVLFCLLAQITHQKEPICANGLCDCALVWNNGWLQIEWNKEGKKATLHVESIWAHLFFLTFFIPLQFLDRLTMSLHQALSNEATRPFSN